MCVPHLYLLYIFSVVKDKNHSLSRSVTAWYQATCRPSYVTPLNFYLIIVRTGHYNHSLPPSTRVVSRFHVKRNKLVASHQHTAILKKHVLLYIHSYVLYGNHIYAYTLRIRVGMDSQIRTCIYSLESIARPHGVASQSSMCIRPASLMDVHRTCRQLI